MSKTNLIVSRVWLTAAIAHQRTLQSSLSARRALGPNFTDPQVVARGAFYRLDDDQPTITTHL